MAVPCRQKRRVRPHGTHEIVQTRRFKVVRPYCQGRILSYVQRLHSLRLAVLRNRGVRSVVSLMFVAWFGLYGFASQYRASTAMQGWHDLLLDQLHSRLTYATRSVLRS